MAAVAFVLLAILYNRGKALVKMITTKINQNQLSDQTQLLKVEDIASILNISRSFAYQLVQTGQIPVVRLGKACRVRPQDLADYIDRNLHTQSSGDIL